MNEGKYNLYSLSLPEVTTILFIIALIEAILASLPARTFDEKVANRLLWVAIGTLGVPLLVYLYVTNRDKILKYL